MDPHKRSATIEIIDERERILDAGRFGTDRDGYQPMLVRARRHPGRCWAVEGCNGIGRHIAQRLVADGETVIDVPSKLSARVRVFATGQGRKTDPVDAHSVAMVGLRVTGLRRIQGDGTSVALGLLVDHRDELERARSQPSTGCYLNLLPAEPRSSCPRPRPARCWPQCGPGMWWGKTSQRLAADLISELTLIDNRIKKADAELHELIAATGSTLLQLHGIGPSSAARLLADIGEIDRFADKGRSPPGTAPHPSTPPPATSAATACPALATGASTEFCTSWLSCSCATTPKAAPTTDANSPPAKTPMEAMRRLKRRLSDVVYRQMITDIQRSAADPGGQAGATPHSSAADPIPMTSTSDKSRPEPTQLTLPL
jgi:hypothetical protein